MLITMIIDDSLAVRLILYFYLESMVAKRLNIVTLKPDHQLKSKVEGYLSGRTQWSLSVQADFWAHVCFQPDIIHPNQNLINFSPAQKGMNGKNGITIPLFWRSLLVIRWLTYSSCFESYISDMQMWISCQWWACNVEDYHLTTLWRGSSDTSSI